MKPEADWLKDLVRDIWFHVADTVQRSNFDDLPFRERSERREAEIEAIMKRLREAFSTTAALREAHEAGRREGVEASAKWHDSVAKECEAKATVYVKRNSPSRKAFEHSAQAHRAHAAALRALAEEGRDVCPPHDRRPPQVPTPASSVS